MSVTYGRFSFSITLPLSSSPLIYFVVATRCRPTPSYDRHKSPNRPRSSWHRSATSPPRVVTNGRFSSRRQVPGMPSSLLLRPRSPYLVTGDSKDSSFRKSMESTSRRLARRTGQSIQNHGVHTSFCGSRVGEPTWCCKSPDSMSWTSSMSLLMDVFVPVTAFMRWPAWLATFFSRLLAPPCEWIRLSRCSALLCGPLYRRAAYLFISPARSVRWSLLPR